MKNSVKFSEKIYLLLVFGFLILCSSVTGQDNPKTSAPLPDNINKIVSASCMPCHSSNGGMLSKSKLNFSEWTEYSADKQKKKAAKMYKELSKNAMPPKDARETNPDILPTKEQIKTIKAWSESF